MSGRRGLSSRRVGREGATVLGFGAARRARLKIKPMTKLTLYSKPGCCLCEEARAAVDGLRERHRFELEQVDISGDPRLLDRYGQRIPVVLVDGVAAAEHHVDVGELSRALERTSGGLELTAPGPWSA